MDTILSLAKAFSGYKIYPKEKFTSGTPVAVFQHLYPSNYFTRDVKAMLNHQNYPSIKKGADLPWWGENVFNEQWKGQRIMLIAQDSNASDAGSVVMYSPLYTEITNYSEVAYNRYIDLLETKDLFKYHSWKRALLQIKSWGLDLKSIYFTDAKKVYKDRIPGKKDTFDNYQSAKLLEKEIEIVKPDYIITLGKQAFDLLGKTTFFKDNRTYGEAVECGEVIPLTHGKLIVSPFITGQCHTSTNFQKRIKIATELIQKEISNEE
ncbi:hypothetical protein A8F94_14035 [Bacillus sp. FJAT-27225]|uniref:uracil-DNA glycosylase family protein n=1 Tax=Bacillus sp. FJAT-27225 TaxID=1743144 RepID=UPI00080C34C8|nr:hypothetical protein [Bacillus sp. FJAT-27225]OCA85962.1 hypothetical protein A8F94_14035 [Bacillus sp. FJAT-27225]